MPVKQARVFSRDYKVCAVRRIEAGDNVSLLARELGVRRKLLYEWRDAFRAGGADALRSRGRPRKGTVVVGARSKPTAGTAGGPGAELAAAKQRIAALERKVGQQALEADFFEQALQLLEPSRQASNRPGEIASMASSRPGCSGKAAKRD